MLTALFRCFPAHSLRLQPVPDSLRKDQWLKRFLFSSITVLPSSLINAALLRVRQNVQNSFRRVAKFRAERCHYHYHRQVDEVRLGQHSVQQRSSLNRSFTRVPAALWLRIFAQQKHTLIPISPIRFFSSSRVGGVSKPRIMAGSTLLLRISTRVRDVPQTGSVSQKVPTDQYMCRSNSTADRNVYLCQSEQPQQNGQVAGGHDFRAEVAGDNIGVNHRLLNHVICTNASSELAKTRASNHSRSSGELKRGLVYRVMSGMKTKAENVVRPLINWL